MIIGLCGDMGAGKDTTYQAIKSVLSDRNVVRYAFADALKDSALGLFQCFDRPGLEAAKVDPTIHIQVRRHNTEVLESMTVRTFLQRYGTEAHRSVFGEDFWTDYLMERISHEQDEETIAVITDVRFENEALAVARFDGLLWRVVSDKSFKQAESSHASEGGIPLRYISWTIDNGPQDWSLLKEKVEQALSFVTH